MSLIDDACWDFPFIVLHRPECDGQCTPRPAPDPETMAHSEDHAELLAAYLISLAASAAAGALDPAINDTIVQTLLAMGILHRLGKNTYAVTVPVPTSIASRFRVMAIRGEKNWRQARKRGEDVPHENPFRNRKKNPFTGPPID